MPEVITIGDAMLDVRVASATLRRGGDVEGDVRIRPAGTSANAAAWAASCGASVRLHARVGDDPAGRMIADALRDAGVDPALSIDPVLPTGAMLIVHEAGERSMVSDRGANAALATDDLPARIDARAVLVSGYLVLGATTTSTAVAALSRADADVVAVDAASWPLLRSFGVERFREAIAGCTLLIANEDEAEALTGARGEAALSGLAAMGAGRAALKLGARGALLAWDGATHDHRPEPIEAVDATGAGDAFDGALLASLACGSAPQDALRRACEAGAAAVASLDTWPTTGAATGAAGPVGAAGGAGGGER